MSDRCLSDTGHPTGPRRVQFFVAVDQALMPVEPFQFHACWRQTEEAHAAVH